jgi:hypothetical protein
MKPEKLYPESLRADYLPPDPFSLIKKDQVPGNGISKPKALAIVGHREVRF